MSQILFLGAYLLVILTCSCSVKKITFFSNEPANVSIVPFADASGEGSLVGQAPVTVTVDTINQGYIKVWGENMETQNWIITDLLGENTQANIKLKKIESGEKNDDKDKTDEEKDKEDEKKNQDAKKQGEDRSIEQNKNFRLILNAYQALAQSRWQEARDLSSQLSKAMPNIAAPHIITGLSFLSEGNRAAASSAFNIAKTLDPTDADLEKLIRLSQ